MQKLLHLGSASTPLYGGGDTISLKDGFELLIGEAADGLEEFFNGYSLLLEGLLHCHDAVFVSILLRSKIYDSRETNVTFRNLTFLRKGH